MEERDSTKANNNKAKQKITKIQSEKKRKECLENFLDRHQNFDRTNIYEIDRHLSNIQTL